MPSFHTKTIESILDPVAQQVSQLVILHEEGESGGAMPDLSVPIQAVGAAVQNLVVVAKETANLSKDELLKRDMPPAYTKVEDSSGKLVTASKLLRQDPYSQEARSYLIDGARGILNGTAQLLIVFDQGEVRKILAACQGVLDYIAVAEVIEVMPDCVTFLKNLSPGLLSMSKKIDARIPDLTNQIHASNLSKHINEVKMSSPVLISAIKSVITSLENNYGVQEAAENRVYVIRKMMYHIREIMYILQLTTSDDWMLGDVATLKRNRENMLSLTKLAKDWLANPDAPIGGVGEAAIREMLADAKKIGEITGDQKVLGLEKDISGMMDQLVEARRKGQGSSPAALQLARDINQKLDLLQKYVDDANARYMQNPAPKPAPTLGGKMEQAQKYIQDPRYRPNDLGKLAIENMLGDARKLAEDLSGPEKRELLDSVANAERLLKQLNELKKQGKGNTPEAQRIAAELAKELDKIQQMLQGSVTKKVVDDFMDTGTPLKQLEKAASAPPGTPNREAEFHDKAGAFLNHTNRVVDTAKLVAKAQKTDNTQVMEEIFANAKELQDLAPHVVSAANIWLNMPGNAQAEAHFITMRDEYRKRIDNLTAYVDEATDTFEFIKATEESLKRDDAAVKKGMAEGDLHTVLSKGGNMARKANRVVQVANMEAENSEDPEFKQNVGGATNEVQNCIGPLVQSTKNVAMNPGSQPVKVEWTGASGRLIENVGAVRKQFQEEAPPPPPPPIEALNINTEESAPPVPPLPMGEVPPPRPPPPGEESMKMMRDPVQSDEPIMRAAYDLHVEAGKWSSADNSLIAAAKRMAILMAQMSSYVREDSGGSKKGLIDLAKQIVKASNEVTRLAMEIAKQCTDRKMRMGLLQVCERIPTIATQLKIISTVKATLLGVSDSQEEIEATEVLIGNAQNLMQAVKETVRSAEAASIKIRTGTGARVRWVRRNPWYS